MIAIAPGFALARGIADHRERGRAGERWAARQLRRRGVRIVARRLLTRFAEVDLVAIDGDTVVCVEVKTGRAGVRWSPGMRLGMRQIGALRAAARELARRLSRPRHRVDLAEVCLEEERARPRLRWRRDVRTPLRNTVQQRIRMR